MARINLLPWREERRRQQKQEFFAMLAAGAVAGVLVVLLVSWQMNQRMDYQNARNRYLQNEIKKLDQQIKEIKSLEETRAKLLARKAVIEELQASRSQMVHLFDALVRTIPEGVRLSSIKQQGQILTLDGLAQSNARVSAYMRSLDNNPWFDTPDLMVIKAVEKDKKEKEKSFGLEASYKYQFTLKVPLHREEDEQESVDEQPAKGKKGGGK